MILIGAPTQVLVLIATRDNGEEIEESGWMEEIDHNHRSTTDTIPLLRSSVP
jgi:hypothetical protein